MLGLNWEDYEGPMGRVCLTEYHKEFKGLSEMNSELARKNKYPTTLAFGGGVVYKLQILKGRMEE